MKPNKTWKIKCFQTLTHSFAFHPAPPPPTPQGVKQAGNEAVLGVCDDMQDTAVSSMDKQGKKFNSTTEMEWMETHQHDGNDVTQSTTLFHLI